MNEQTSWKNTKNQDSSKHESVELDSFHFQLTCFPPSSNLSFSFFYFHQEFFNLITIKSDNVRNDKVCSRNAPENFQFLDKIDNHILN